MKIRKLRPCRNRVFCFGLGEWKDNPPIVILRLDRGIKRSDKCRREGEGNMKKKAIFVLITVIGISFLNNGITRADDTFNNAANMAKEIHAKVATDVIYTDQEIKALYYQNVQMIQLMGEMIDLMRQQLQELRAANKTAR